MEPIKKLKEDAAGGAMGAGAIGAFSMPLFSSIVRRSNAASTKQPPKIIKYKKRAPVKAPFSFGLKEAMQRVFENDPTAPTPDFDTTEVIAKLKSLENHEKQDMRDTTTFGLEDDAGALIRVTVRGEQAEEFEKQLHALMTNSDEEELPEIAEILYKMKDKFDIVDVEWPEVEEDEEVDQSVEGGEQPADGEMPMDGEVPLDGEAPMDAGGANPQDLLTAVIDMMKADAEARKADARAREAEAKNREAEAAIGQAQNRVKEEELLDMDTHNKRKKEEAKEAKRLAQLAQWKSEVDSDGGDDDGDFGLGDSIRGQSQQQPPAHEEEEITHRRPQAVQPQQPRKGSTIGGRVHPHDIARYILNRMR
jgi:hypothetical protein